MLSQIPPDVMMQVFLHGGDFGGAMNALTAFEGGLHTAYPVIFTAIVVAAVDSLLRPAHRPAMAAEQSQTK